jgi:hypothetical protein|tara:strand:- start:9168 stop:9350 length:183 start_codon:yes stop_codon:yes gene_type:complete
LAHPAAAIASATDAAADAADAADAANVATAAANRAAAARVTVEHRLVAATDGARLNHIYF